MTKPRVGNFVPKTGNRHPNCKPMRILADTRPAISMSGQTKRDIRAQMEREVDEYLKRGNQITELESQQAGNMRKPAFNYLPAEYEGAA